jgi:Predicted periplasmic or secreted lipoprotein
MKLPRVTGDLVVKALKRAEFEEVRMRGSHCHLYHPGKNKLVTVPVHAGKIVAPKTRYIAKKMLAYARIYLST